MSFVLSGLTRNGIGVENGRSAGDRRDELAESVGLDEGEHLIAIGDCKVFWDVHVFPGEVGTALNGKRDLRHSARWARYR